MVLCFRPSPFCSLYTELLPITGFPLVEGFSGLPWRCGFLHYQRCDTGLYRMGSFMEIRESRSVEIHFVIGTVPRHRTARFGLAPKKPYSQYIEQLLQPFRGSIADLSLSCSRFPIPRNWLSAG